jgi:hypothetical protein
MYTRIMHILSNLPGMHVYVYVYMYVHGLYSAHMRLHTNTYIYRLRKSVEAARTGIMFAVYGFACSDSDSDIDSDSDSESDSENFLYCERG